MKLNRILIAALILCNVLIGAVWSEPEKILFTGAAPTICIDNDAIAWVVSWDWILNYPDEQTGWQKVTERYFDGWYLKRPACFDQNGLLWVFNGTTQIYYSRYNGDSWSELDTVDWPYMAIYCYVTADSSGGVWAGWITDAWYYMNTVYNRYVDGKWDEAQALTDIMEDADHKIHAMATDVYGRVWIVWENVYMHWLDPEHYVSLESAYYNGADWSEEILICIVDEKWSDGKFGGMEEEYNVLDLVPDQYGGMWALWSGTIEGSRPHIFASYCDGESWTPVDSVAYVRYLTNGLHRVKGRIDAYGNLWAVWREALEEGDGYGDIYYSVNSGSGWSEPAPVNEHPAVDRYPDIAVDGEGRIWCVWSSDRDDSAGIWASYTTSAGVAEEGFIQPPRSTIESILPNPFKSSTTISYSVAGKLSSKENQHVELSIFDVTGREVKVLASGEKSPGHYEIIWNGCDSKGLKCPSGVYFIRMHSNEFNANARLVLLR